MERRDLLKAAAASGAAVISAVELSAHAADPAVERISYEEAVEIAERQYEKYLQAGRFERETNAPSNCRGVILGLGKCGPGDFTREIGGIAPEVIGVVGNLTEYSGHVGAAVIRTSSVQLHRGGRFIRVAGHTGSYAQDLSLCAILFYG